ncbi:MAG: transposase, partial [Deltaproteobacteria bacterium]|nr:transposase [Deltaproteobacteria bacterium]
LTALIAIPGQWVDRVRQRRPLKKLILDMDSSVSPTHGQQEGSRYNGHFGCTCYHPLFLFNQDGDVERTMLRHGNVASADDWRAVLLPVIERYREVDVPKYFRGDAAHPAALRPARIRGLRVRDPAQGEQRVAAPD